VYNPPVQPQPQVQAQQPIASTGSVELEEEDEEKKLVKEDAKRRKALIAKGVGLISNAASLALILLVVFVVYSAAAGDDHGVAVGPLRFFSVLTSSMEPAISQGSVIVTVEPGEGELEKGDIVTFMPTEESAALVTHRISKVGPNPGTYITRGDANAVDDREISFEQIVGKHVFTIPFLGLMIYPLASPLSTVWLASIAMLFVLMLWIIKKIFQDGD
jgi:signal peptidase